MKPFFTVYETTTDTTISHHETYEGETGAKAFAMKHALLHPSREYLVMAPIVRVKKVDLEVKHFSREGLPEVP